MACEVSPLSDCVWFGLRWSSLVALWVLRLGVSVLWSCLFVCLFVGVELCSKRCLGFAVRAG